MILNVNTLGDRFSSTYKIGGTKTLRLSSTQILETFGGNAQNWKKFLRRIIIPDPGYIFVQVDQAGAEALIVAYLCRAGNYRKLFEYKVKPHTFVALHRFQDVWRSKFHNKEVVERALKAKIEDFKELEGWKELAAFIQSSDNWSDSERYYYLGKKIVHAGSYGMQANKFVMAVLEETEGKLVIEKKDAQKSLDLFHSLFSEIREWHFRTQSQYRKEKRLYNLFGFPYQVTDFIGDDFNELYAWVPQSTVGCITNIASTELQDYIEAENLNWHLLTNTHDSYLAEVPIGDELKAAKIMQQFIGKEFISPVDQVKFRMRSEAVCGMNWCPYKKGINENGLKEIEVI